MQFSKQILALIWVVMQSSSFIADARPNELKTTNIFEEILEMNETNETGKRREMETEMATGAILTVNDFLIEGDVDYDGVNSTYNDSNVDVKVDVDADEGFEDDVYFDGRIVGGIAVSIQQFPHQVSLQFKNVHICGGSIVAPNLIITAAHCIGNSKVPTQYTVRVGSSQHKHGGELVDVSRVISHELFAPQTFDNDVAIVVLARRLYYNKNIQPIAIAEKNDIIPANRKLFTSGWGYIRETASLSPLLRFVTVRLLDDATCSRSYKLLGRITTRMFCAGSNGGRDSCQGDSGGPLISYERNNRPKLFGIVSWGNGCGQERYPGVYTRISALRPWINSKIQEFQIPNNV